MNRFAISAAVAAVTALSAVAAQAADTVRAGNVYSARELLVSGLSESDLVEFETRNQAPVRAGDVYSSRELAVSGLNADDMVTVSNFADGSANPSNNFQRGWRADR